MQNKFAAKMQRLGFERKETLRTSAAMHRLSLVFSVAILEYVGVVAICASKMQVCRLTLRFSACRLLQSDIKLGYAFLDGRESTHCEMKN